MKLLIFPLCCVLLCKLAAGHEEEGCREAVGMENEKIADDQITASSERKVYPAVNGRLHYKSILRGRPFGWQPTNSRYTEWLQVDLLDDYTVKGVATQGCLTNRKSKLVFSVTKYQLEYSNDGKVFYTDHKLYKGNTDESTVVCNNLKTPIKARYIRFRPKSWRNKICMRVELYGNIAKACDSSPCLNGGTCFEDESGAKEYICKCTSGWKGDNCEEKHFTGSLTSSSILDSLDSKYRAKLNSYLEPVLQSPNHTRFMRCWHAKTDGWAASTFHRNCDGMGPTVTIVQVGSYIFGGYTDRSWSSPSSQEAVSSSKSFLFSLYNINGYAPVKVNIKSSQQSYSRAIYGCSDYGPAFGAGFDLYISNNAASNRKSFTNCGWTYPLPPGYDAPHSSCRFYAGGSSFYFTPTDVEVFFDDNNLRRWCKTYDSANFYGLAK